LHLNRNIYKINYTLRREKHQENKNNGGRKIADRLKYL